jgi:hypothetical protein
VREAQKETDFDIKCVSMINSKPMDSYIKLIPLEEFLKREKEIFKESDNKKFNTTIDDWVGKLKEGLK